MLIRQQQKKGSSARLPHPGGTNISHNSWGQAQQNSSQHLKQMVEYLLKKFFVHCKLDNETTTYLLINF